MSKCNETFWLENIKNLFCSVQIVPTTNMSLEQQMNALTRFTIFIFLILLLVNYKYDLIFLFFALIIIIILYYLQRSRMSNIQENFQMNRKKYTKIFSENPTFSAPLNKVEDRSDFICQPMKTVKTRNDNIEVNETLTENPLPRKGSNLKDVWFQAPMFSGAWRNNLTVPTGINAFKNEFFSDSGYIPTGECPKLYRDPCSQSQSANNDLFSSNEPKLNAIKENFEMPKYEKHNEKKEGVYDDPENLYFLNSMGFNKDQLKVNLPENLNMGEKARGKEFSGFNKNLFTNNLQENIFTKNQLISPISSNIGITYTQPHFNEKVVKSGNDMTFIGSAFGELSEKVKARNPDVIERFNVFDPRFSGYSNNDRYYIDPVTGQPRFFYDDINAHTKNTYVTRNNLDHTNIGTSMSHMNTMNGLSVRKYAHEQYLNDSLNFRTGLQQRLMRKNNHVMWQKRMYPKYTT